MTTRTLPGRYTTDVPRRAPTTDAETIRRLPVFTFAAGHVAEREDSGDLAIFELLDPGDRRVTDGAPPIDTVADLARYARAQNARGRPAGDIEMGGRRRVGAFHGLEYVAEARGDELEIFRIADADGTSQVEAIAAADQRPGPIQSVADLSRVARRIYARR